MSLADCSDSVNKRFGPNASMGILMIFGLWLAVILGCKLSGDRNQNISFNPPPENRTVQVQTDKFSGQSVYTVGLLLVSFDEKIDEPLQMTVNIFFTESNKKPFRTMLLFTAKTFDIGEKKYRRGDTVYALADGERVIAGQIQMHKDETAYWGSVDRLQGFTVDTTPQALQKLASASNVEFRVSVTEFTLKPEHKEALRTLLERAQIEGKK